MNNDAFVSINATIIIPKRGILIKDINFSLHSKERLALLGPNGSGKTTIIKALLGEHQYASGELALNISKSQIGYMPQNFREALFPWLPVKNNIELYKSNRGDFSTERFYSTLNKLMLTGILSSTVKTLSGGEQQLLLLCLTLSCGNKLLLLDEPFSAVDLSRRGVARKLLSNSLRETGSTLILVTHDLDDAVRLSSRAVVLSGSAKLGAKYLAMESPDTYMKKLHEEIYS